MTQRDITRVLVDIIRYDYFWPAPSNEDAVYGFTHSLEVNAICADMLPPHVVTPVEKDALEDALAEYVSRKGISAEDEEEIRTWLAQMPDQVAIIEREPYPFG
jgi:hypothetical protein